MAKIVFREKAIQDLSDIWECTVQEWSETQADKYYHSLKYACSELGENPGIGNRYTRISNQLLGLKSGKHIIFYIMITDEEIEIVRIVHESMDLKNRLTQR